MIGVNRKYRNLRRYRQIVGVLVKYGFDEILSRMNLTSYLRVGKRFFKKGEGEREPLSAPTRIRMALEELGPTFVKLGQILSTRPFLIPPDLVVELSKLQDEVKPLDFPQIKKQIENELGAPIDELFQNFEERPIASASLAQAHRARIRDGIEVVVKVQRPDIEKVIQADMDILRDLARLLVRYVPESRQFNPLDIVEEIARTMRKELDFMNEARNVEHFRKNFQGVDFIYIPRVFWEFTTSKVITLEYIDGIKISEVDKIEAAGLDRKLIARIGSRFILKQVLEDGFFHADPHPGNIFVTEGNIIVPVDFGMMGSLDPRTMEELSDLLIAAAKKDTDLILRVMVDFGIISDDSDTSALRADISELLNRYYEVPLAKINMKTIMDEASEIVNRYNLRAPSNLMLLMKAMGTYEELGRTLDPDFDLIAEAKPYIKRLLRRRLQPDRIAYESLKTMRDLYNLIKILPRETELLLRRLKRGEVSLEFQHRGLENLITELDRASNRLSFSLIIAALIVGSSLILRLNIGPFLFGYPLLGILGYLFAGLLGIWLVVAILRSGRI